jgi:hypothetical protein
LHLHDLFKLYCLSGPKLNVRIPSKVYSSLRFQTMALPCFNEFYDLFFFAWDKSSAFKHKRAINTFKLGLLGLLPGLFIFFPEENKAKNFVNSNNASYDDV